MLSLSGWWFQPLWKKSVRKIKFMFQTTNQLLFRGRNLPTSIFLGCEKHTIWYQHGSKDLTGHRWCSIWWLSPGSDQPMLVKWMVFHRVKQCHVYHPRVAIFIGDINHSQMGGCYCFTHITRVSMCRSEYFFIIYVVPVLYIYIYIYYIYYIYIY